MGNELHVEWAVLPDMHTHSFYARRGAEPGEFRIYCRGAPSAGRQVYTWNVAVVKKVPAAVYDETMANMVTLAEARYGNT